MCCIEELLWCVCTVLTAVCGSQPTESNWEYYPNSVRNYNSGARYYLRNVDNQTTLDTFGYSYNAHPGSGSAIYYYSGYGYRLYLAPRDYKPVYVGSSYFYLPPMFYYYRSNLKYWDDIGERPRFVCRNENAFWPLENQTSEFVQGRPPVLDLRSFESFVTSSESGKYLFESDGYDAQFQSHNSSNRVMLNEPVLQDLPKFRNWKNDDVAVGFAHSVSRTQKIILAYDYFACPDGKDPEETYCCGSSDVQFCCSERAFNKQAEIELKSIIHPIITYVSVFVLLTLSVVSCLLRRRIIIRRRTNAAQVATPASTGVTSSRIAYVPATTSNDVRDNATVTVSTSYDDAAPPPYYQAAQSDAPPSYESVMMATP